MEEDPGPLRKLPDVDALLAPQTKVADLLGERIIDGLIKLVNRFRTEFAIGVRVILHSTIVGVTTESVKSWSDEKLTNEFTANQKALRPEELCKFACYETRATKFEHYKALKREEAILLAELERREAFNKM